MELAFPEWQNQALALLKPSEMIYTVDLRKLWKEGVTPAQAIMLARNRKLVHKRGSDSAPAPIINRGGRPRIVGVKRKPHWELALIQAKIKAAVFAICVEAETHRLEPDAVDYVRQTKRKLAE